MDRIDRDRKRSPRSFPVHRHLLVLASVLLIPSATLAFTDGWEVDSSGLRRSTPWTWETEPSNNLNAVWMAASGEAVAVGDGGLIRHWDGLEWRTAPYPTSMNLYSVIGFSPDSILAAGGDPHRSGVILLWDGISWELAPINQSIDCVYQIWGTSPDDLYARTDGDEDFLHWTGAGWDQIDVGPQGSQSHWITGYAPEEVYLSDSSGIFRWDGFSAAPIAPPAPRPADRMHCPSPDLLLTIKDRIVSIWENQAWIDLPALEPPSRIWTGLWGASSDHIFVTGGQESIQRWDGTMWLPRTGGSNATELLGVHGRAENQAFAVGRRGHILQWFPPSWNQQVTSLPVRFERVEGWSSDEVIALGPDERTAYHWNGQEWTQQDIEVDADLTALAFVETGSAFAVGEAGTIVHWDGRVWAPMVSGTNRTLWSVWGSSANDVYAAGHQVLLHYDGSGWEPLWDDGPGTFTGSAIWGTGPEDLYVQRGRDLEYWDGSDWTTVLTGHDFYVIWGSGPNDVYVGTTGEVPPPLYHWDGRGWSSQILNLLGQGYQRIIGTGPDDVWALDWSDAVAHWDGTSWSAMTLHEGYSPTRLFGGYPGAVYVFSEPVPSKLWRWTGSSWTPEIGFSESSDDLWTSPQGDSFLVGQSFIRRRAEDLPPSPLRVRLDLPAWTSPGEAFWVNGQITNWWAPLEEVPVFFVLELAGDYWFWPGWTQQVDHRDLDIPMGGLLVEVIPRLTWPATGQDTLDNLWLHGAMLNQEMTELLGEMDSRQFGYGP